MTETDRANRYGVLRKLVALVVASAEHGIGSLKAHELPRYKSPMALQLMRAIKAALDPQGIMNPGRVLV